MNHLHVFLIITFTLIGGCTTVYSWTKQNITTEQRFQDISECRTVAENIKSNPDEVYELCMHGKGYKLESRQDISFTLRF